MTKYDDNIYIYQNLYYNIYQKMQDGCLRTFKNVMIFFFKFVDDCDKH